MDDSETYTKMADHEKIQSLWEPKIGDWTNYGQVHGFKPFQNVPGKYFIVLDSGKIWHPDNSDLIWLPRQDQLIEMLPENQTWSLYYWESPVDKEHFTFLMGSILGCSRGEFNGSSAEQALIQGVMYQHGLRWDGGWKEG